MTDAQFIIYLRDCFSAGYQMPQFCIDNNIKKPLFMVIDESCWQILWEIHAQFEHDKRIKPQFVFLKDKSTSVKVSPSTLFNKINIKNYEEADLNNCDKVIFLTQKKSDNHADKIIYLDELARKFVHAVYLENPMANFLERNPNIKLFITNFPLLYPYFEKTGNEQKIFDENILLEKILAELRKNSEYKTPYDFLGYSRQDLIDLLTLTGTKTNPDGSTVLIDNDNPLINVKNGRRVTAYQPKKYKNTIYFLGGCSHLGVGAPYDKTIESYLQKMLNEKNLPYRVENVSQFFTYRYQDIFYNLNKLELIDGDIIFIFFDNMLSEKLPYFDVSKTFERPHNYGEIFVNNTHVNELGYKALAEQYFKFLVNYKFFQHEKLNYPKPVPPPHRYGIPQENFSVKNNLQNAELEEYKKKLREKRFAVGAIVMNCNPFTLGHEYLVEYASKRVKKLFIFVVEEDKSEFKFADRFELVKRGVKKFSNVEVLPSGKFIISQQTFSGYFNKENLQDVLVDSSEDVEIFAREIAPSLGITVRFVGEEPEDSVTRQYNDNMKRILPRYNIELCEIPRKILNGEVISAKKVREALHEKDFDKIKKLVPKTTLKFLLDRKEYND